MTKIKNETNDIKSTFASGPDEISVAILKEFNFTESLEYYQICGRWQQ